VPGQSWDPSCGEEGCTDCIGEVLRRATPAQDDRARECQVLPADTRKSKRGATVTNRRYRPGSEAPIAAGSLHPSLPYHVRRFCRSRGLPSYSVGASVPICRAGAPPPRLSDVNAADLATQACHPKPQKGGEDLANLWGGASRICACDLGRFFAALCRLRMTTRWNAVSRNPTMPVGMLNGRPETLTISSGAAFPG
jgi:hypothetical protein